MTMLAGFRSGVHESWCFFSKNMFFFFLIAAKIQAKIQKHSEDCGQEERIEERSAKEHLA